MYWSRRAFCPCGWSTEPSFGNVWFAEKRYPCCPECGASCYGYQMHTVSYVVEPTGERYFFGLFAKKRGYYLSKNGDRVEPLQLASQSP